MKQQDRMNLTSKSAGFRESFLCAGKNCQASVVVSAKVVDKYARTQRLAPFLSDLLSHRLIGTLAARGLWLCLTGL